MAHRLKWDDLQFILQVAEHGSVSAAARNLGVNHATVLRRVSAFESANQIRLFDRQSSGYALSPQSRHLLPMLRRMALASTDFERSIKGLGDPFEGPIRITSTDTICQLILVRHIQRLKRDYPLISVDLSSTNNRLDLTRFDADITIRPAVAISDGLAGERLCDLGFRVYGAPAYLSENRLDGYENHTWLGISETLSRSPVVKWQEESIAGSIVFTADSFLVLRDAAECGMGLALLPSFVGDRSEILAPVHQFPVYLNTAIWVAAHRDIAEAPRLRTLMNWFIQAMQDDIPLLEGRLSEPEQ